MSLKYEPSLDPLHISVFNDYLVVSLPGAVCQFFFFFTLVTGPRRSLSLKLSDTRVYEPQIRARLGTTAQWVVSGQRVLS